MFTWSINRSEAFFAPLSDPNSTGHCVIASSVSVVFLIIIFCDFFS